MFPTGYLSFDASVKIHHSGRYTSTKTDSTGHGGIRGYIRHIDRGTDRKNHCEVQHKNPDINLEFTLENESYFKDRNGEWRKTARSGDMAQAAERRMKYASDRGARIAGKGQNDTVVARPLLVQLDKETIKEHEETWIWDVMEILEETFGAENITGFSVHRDETNIHLHIIFIPCYETQDKNGKEKCTLSQTKFFKNPKQLASMHRKIRKRLCEKGYDIEQENKPVEEQLAGYYDKAGQWHQQGLTPEQLKQLTDRELSLRIEEINMRLRKDELDRLEQAMKEMQTAAREKQTQIDRERETLTVQQTALENDRATVQAQIQTLVAEKVAVQQMKQDAENMLKKANDTAEVCGQILAEEKNLNKEFLKFLDREGKRTNRQVRQFVEYLYKKFQKERRESLSDWQLEMLRLRADQKQNDTVNPVPDIISTKADTAAYDYSL